MKKQLFAFAFAACLLAGCENRKEVTETTETTETTVLEQDTVVIDSVSTDLDAPVTEIEEAADNVDSLLNEI